jgi:C-terminal processing protease CtpA/Prc
MKDTTPVRYFQRQHSITDSSEFFKFSDLSTEDRANAKRELVAQTDGTFTLDEKYNNVLKLQYAKPNRFTGKIYFLVNGGSGSTTSEFLAVAHSNHLGIFIGGETGGAYEGDNGGSFLHFQLPNSAISVGTPLLYYNNAVKTPAQNGRGVIPDYKVTLTKEDLLNARDTQLEFTLDLIRKGK